MENQNQVWDSFSADEKLQRRIKAWLEPTEVKFVSKQAEADYKARAGRLIDAMLMKKPDRVHMFNTSFLKRPKANLEFVKKSHPIQGYSLEIPKEFPWWG